MPDRTLPRATIEALLERVAPGWELRSATLAESGHLPVYHLSVATPDGPDEVVLKADPGDGDHGIALEARLLAALAERTEVPVPAVLGAVDEPDVAGPSADAPPRAAVVMASVPGESVPRTEMDRLAPAEFERVARQVGTALGELHGLDAVDAFGFLAADPAVALDGERPPADLDAVAVVDPEPDWPTRLRGWVDGALEGLGDTRFADLRGDVAPVLRERVDALEGPFEPALGHVDGAVENLVLAGDRSVVAMLDWAFTMAVPPAYDLAFVEQSLAGGLWAPAPAAPDVREPVRRGLLAGYRGTGSTAVLERYRRHRGCYDLFALVTALTLFADWYDERDVGDDQVEAAARGHRRAVRERAGLG